MEEGRVVAGRVVWELLWVALDRDVLRKHPLPASVYGFTAEGLEGDMVDADRVPVVWDRMGI